MTPIEEKHVALGVFGSVVLVALFGLMLFDDNSITGNILSQGPAEDAGGAGGGSLESSPAPRPSCPLCPPGGRPCVKPDGSCGNCVVKGMKEYRSPGRRGLMPQYACEGFVP